MLRSALRCSDELEQLAMSTMSSTLLIDVRGKTAYTYKWKEVGMVGMISLRVLILAPVLVECLDNADFVHSCGRT